MLLLLGFIGVLICLPAYIVGELWHWQVPVAYASYVFLFSSAILRSFLYGNLSKQKDDRQRKTRKDNLSYKVMVFGLPISHWVGIYEFFYPMIPLPQILSFVLTPLSLILMTLAIVLNHHSAYRLGKFYDRLNILDEHRLIKNGAYRLIRHPIYTSYLLLFTGFCFLFASPLAFVLIMTVCIIGYRSRIKVEEEMLLQRFGKEYSGYMKGTKRLFPFLY